MGHRLTWNNVGERYYETGVDRGVLFVQKEDGSYNAGVAWNGLRSVDENPDGGEPTKLYADNVEYAVMRSTENFKATIGAYMSPPEFDECDGSKELIAGISVGQQDRTPFALSYRTRIESDTKKGDSAYKIHIVYNATTSPSEKNHETVNDSPAAMELSWEIDTTPISVDGCNPTAHVTIDSRVVSPKALKEIEDTLYGTETKESALILPNQLKILVQQLMDSDRAVIVDNKDQSLNTTEL